MNKPSPIGHNNAPDPLDEIPAQFEDDRTEAESWLDGAPVETEDQMKAVDKLRKAMRQCRLDLVAAQKSESAPLYDAYKSALDRWKATIEDTQAIEKGLVALVDDFKRKLVIKKERAEAAARAEARKAQEAAERAAREADAANIEQQRAAQEAIEAAKEAQAKAVAASKDTVKGLKTKTLYAVDDHRKLLHWIATNDRDGMTAFIDEWARRNHKTHRNAAGLRVWDEKVAF